MIKDGKIIDISPNITSTENTIDCDDKLILPGIIDLHCDGLEKIIEPRPKNMFPIDIAIHQFDKYLVTCGITTMCYCVAFVYSDFQGRNLRNNKTGQEILVKLRKNSDNLLLNTKIHLRYDILNTDLYNDLMELINNRQIDVLSFMDHTPGQGQYPDIKKYINRTKDYFARYDEEILKTITHKQEVQKKVDYQKLNEIAAACTKNNIILASHDDDSEKKVTWAKSIVVNISEFPVNYEALNAADASNMHIILGAPNVMLGRSQSGNISANEVLKLGYGDILCSDYSPLSLLNSIFVLETNGIKSLHSACNLISLNPAKALNTDSETGSLEIGKNADLTIVDKKDNIPIVKSSIINGKIVYNID